MFWTMIQTSWPMVTIQIAMRIRDADMAEASGVELMDKAVLGMFCPEDMSSVPAIILMEGG